MKDLGPALTTPARWALRKSFYLLSLWAAVVLLISGCGLNKEGMPPQAPGQQQEASDAKPRQSPVPLLQAPVIRVVDGDTIKVDLGGTQETVRLIGVDTPETVKPNHPIEPYGKEASSFTRTQLEGKTVFLEKDAQERDRYGRLLAYVWTAPPVEVSDQEIRVKMFNARLLADGYAQLLTVPPNVRYVEYFTSYQKEAREGKKGLWGLPPEQAGPSAGSNSAKKNAS